MPFMSILSAYQFKSVEASSSSSERILHLFRTHPPDIDCFLDGRGTTSVVELLYKDKLNSAFNEFQSFIECLKLLQSAMDN